MKKQKADKKKISQALEKILTDKQLVVSYIKGKIPLNTLTKKGIKFAKPI
ncbi:MAG: hypothetical protein ABI723_16170 [Bacteroidia bacterium]